MNPNTTPNAAPAPSAATPVKTPTTAGGYPVTPQGMAGASPATNPALLQQQQKLQAQNLSKTQIQQLQYQQMQQQQLAQQQLAAQQQQLQQVQQAAATGQPAAQAQAQAQALQQAQAAQLAAQGVGMGLPAGLQPPPEETEIISRKKLQELVGQISAGEVLDTEVEDVMLEVVDDFIDSVMTFACSLAKHRNSSTLEVRDIQCHLERNWNIRIPGYGNTESVRPFKRPHQGTEGHKTRLALVRKSLVPPPKQQKL